MKIILTCQRCGRKTNSCLKCNGKEFKLTLGERKENEFGCIKCGEPYACPCSGNTFQLERVR